MARSRLFVSIDLLNAILFLSPPFTISKDILLALMPRDDVKFLIFTGTGGRIRLGCKHSRTRAVELDHCASILTTWPAGVPENCGCSATNNCRDQRLLHGGRIGSRARVRHSSSIDRCKSSLIPAPGLESLLAGEGHKDSRIIGSARALEFFATARRYSSPKALESVEQLHRHLTLTRRRAGARSGPSSPPLVRAGTGGRLR